MEASEKKLAHETEQRDAELALKVANATLDQMKVKLESDLALLRQRIPSKEVEAQNAALDIKYISDRQRRLGMLLEMECFHFHYSNMGEYECM